MSSSIHWMRSSCHQMRFIFTLVLLVAMLMGAAVPATNASMQSTATLELTLRGCPEGVIPQNGNPAASCTVPLDAPDMATIWHGTGSVSVSHASRDWSGTYRVTVPANVQASLQGFEPAVRDDFHVVGVDGIGQHGHPVVKLAPGETRHIGIYYYYYADTSSSSGNPQNSSSPNTSSSESSSVAIITSIAGWPYTSACYELVDHREPVCSVMIRDMTYAAVFPKVPPGTYTVRQTAEIEDGYVPDFEIEVTGGEQEFWADVVMSWGSPSRLGAAHNDPGMEDGFDVIPIEYDTSAPDFWNTQTNHVSFVFIDTVTQEKVVSDACVQIVGISNVTCDTQRGQIDVMDVPVGDHEVIVTSVPDGYKLAPGMEELRLQPIGRNPHAPVHIVYFIDVSPTEI